MTDYKNDCHSCDIPPAKGVRFLGFDLTAQKLAVEHRNTSYFTFTSEKIFQNYKCQY
jgi:hypothetical protein